MEEAHGELSAGEGAARPRGRRTRSFLELFRVFLTPSAVADPLAGYGLAVGFLERTLERPALLLACGASVALYWMGMATNDLFDLEKDRRRSPERPLPSRRILPWQAAAASAVLGLAALAMAHLAGAGAPAAAVLVLALAYNAGGKKLPLAGNLLMGGCRAGNLLLGAAAAGGLASPVRPEILLAACILGLYVAGITAVSVLEDREPRRAPLAAFAAPLFLVPLLLVALRPQSPWNWLNAAALGMVLLAPLWRGLRGPTPVHPATLFVRSGLGGIFLVDAGLLWSLHPGVDGTAGPPVLSMYALMVLAWLWKRRWLQSGGLDT
jgi:heme O synthase-like polyprenyltransferase